MKKLTLIIMAFLSFSVFSQVDYEVLFSDGDFLEYKANEEITYSIQKKMIGEMEVMYLIESTKDKNDGEIDQVKFQIDEMERNIDDYLYYIEAVDLDERLGVEIYIYTEGRVTVVDMMYSDETLISKQGNIKLKLD